MCFIFETDIWLPWRRPPVFSFDGSRFIFPIDKCPSLLMAFGKGPPVVWGELLLLMGRRGGPWFKFREAITTPAAAEGPAVITIPSPAFWLKSPSLPFMNRAYGPLFARTAQHTRTDGTSLIAFQLIGWLPLLRHFYFEKMRRNSLWAKAINFSPTSANNFFFSFLFFICSLQRWTPREPRKLYLYQ